MAILQVQEIQLKTKPRYMETLTAYISSHNIRVIQMKTLNIFLNTIYCIEVVQSCISFQHNLPHTQCKSSSAYKVHKFL